MIKNITILAILWLSVSCSFENKCNEPVQGDSKLQNSDQIREILENPQDKRVLVIAHRADWRSSPENSLLAIESCITKGIDIAEIDIRRTKDGVLVLMHDETLDRTTNGKGKVEDWTYDSLKLLRLKNGLGWTTDLAIPRFEQALEIAKGRILIQPDVKCKDCFSEVSQTIINENMEGQVVFGSKQTVSESREYFGDLFGKIILVPTISEKTVDIEGEIYEFDSIEPQAYVFKFVTDTASHLLYIPKLKKETRIWVQTIQSHRCGGHDDDLAFVDTDAAYGWLLDKGASIFLTDRPILLLDYLKSKGLHD